MAAGQSGRGDPSLSAPGNKNGTKVHEVPRLSGEIPGTSDSFLLPGASQGAGVWPALLGEFWPTLAIGNFGSTYLTGKRKAAAGEFPTHYLIDLDLEQGLHPSFIWALRQSKPLHPHSRPATRTATTQRNTASVQLTTAHRHHVDCQLVYVPFARPPLHRPHDG